MAAGKKRVGKKSIKSKKHLGTRKNPITVRASDLKKLQAVRRRPGVESFAQAAQIILEGSPKQKNHKGEGSSMRRRAKALGNPLFMAVAKGWLSEQAVETLIAHMEGNSQ